MDNFLIVATPLGDAPLWVREAWVGLSLPTYGPFKVNDHLGHDKDAAPTFSKPDVDKAQIDGFAVQSLMAIKLLEVARPEAASWWRTNRPEVMEPGHTFIFDAAACRQAVQT